MPRRPIPLGPPLPAPAPATVVSGMIVKIITGISTPSTIPRCWMSSLNSLRTTTQILSTPLAFRSVHCFGDGTLLRRLDELEVDVFEGMLGWFDGANVRAGLD